MSKNQKYILWCIMSSVLIVLVLLVAFERPVQYGQGGKGKSFAAAWEDPEAKFNTAVNKSKHSAISWIPVDNLQATCEAESRKRGLGGFGYPVEACSFWSSSHNVCQVFTRSNATTMHSLGHEIRHCFQGNFH
jgi:hypothetical protein